MRAGNPFTRFFSERNVSQQLRALFVITVLIPFLLIGTLVTRSAAEQARSDYEHLCESKAMQVRSVLTTTTIYLYDIYETFAGDEELSSLLSANYADAAQARSAFMTCGLFEKTLNSTAAISSLKLYVEEDILRQAESFYYYYPITEDVLCEDWYIQASSTRQNFWRVEPRTDSAGNQYWELNYYCRIPIPQRSSYAILVVTVSDNHLQSLIRSDDYDIYVSVNSDPVFFSSDRQYPGNAFPAEVSSSAAYYSSTGTMDILGSRMIASIQAFRPYITSDQIYILAADPNAFTYIHRLELACILPLAAALVLSAILIALYAGYFSSRTRTLRLAMHRVAHNDYAIVNSIQGKDELSAAFMDLKTMAATLKEQDAQMYEAQLREQLLINRQQEMELKLLTNQINPHFLYNALETIRMKALSEGNPDVAGAVKTLGKTMRYVLDNTLTSSVTLDRELDHVRNYLAIQQLRFGDRLNYRIDISHAPDPRSCEILPLLIQPLVENAVSHGLKDAGNDGLVVIRVRTEPEDRLLIEVTDNGAGMTPDELQHVITHMNTAPEAGSGHGIGLFNINSRVHLYYGEQYGLELTSHSSASADDPRGGFRVPYTVGGPQEEFSGESGNRCEPFLHGTRVILTIPLRTL